MYILTVDGEEIKWSPRGNRKENCSKNHEIVRELLRVAFPTQPILEEVSIPIYKNKTQFIDFYLPINRLAIEVDGNQHDNFVMHFHKTYSNFILSKKNDSLKVQFCEINDIKLIRLKDNERSRWSEILLPQGSV